MNAQFDHSPQEKNNQKRSSENVGISMPSTILVHAQLEMTNPGDSDEQEADEMADSIVNGGKIARSVSTGHSGSGIALPSQFGSQLASLQGQGSRLYGGLKSQMESGFGRDFSDVRIHTGNAAAEMSDSISARAFTYDNDIYFNRGQFNPETRDGRHLIAHELTHVAQRNGKLGRQEFGKRYNYNKQFEWNNCTYRFYSEDREGQNVLFLERKGGKELKEHDQFWFTLDFKNGQSKGSSKSFHITNSTHKKQKILELITIAPYIEVDPHWDSIPTDTRLATRLNADLSTIRMPLGSGTQFTIIQGFNSTKKHATHKSENALNEHAIDITVSDKISDVPIVAIGAGKVIRVTKGIEKTVTTKERDKSLYEGNSVYIHHTEEIDPETGKPNPLYGYISIYGHLKNEKLPKQGSDVKRGDRIGTMGNTGLSERRHLHFSLVRYDYKSQKFSTTEWSLGNADKNAGKTKMKDKDIESKKGEVDSSGLTKWVEDEEK